ncbi:hypothetical protein FQN54_000243 [Arachnomyces sp. PD_36]|nr:hypothetical protein FQN54_000243 [Arachnomyces sp. PD_36]
MEQELAELKKRFEEEQRRRQEAETRALDERRQREEEQRRREEAEQQTRPTTLSEYIDACHELVFTKFSVETDKSLTSQGSVTNPRHKLCPARLEPWSDFLEQQRTVFGRLYSALPTETAAFESRSFLHGLGQRVSRKKVANEKDLEYFQHNSVEDPVTSIVKHLAAEDSVRGEVDIGNGIVFENHPNAISDVAEEVVNRRVNRPPTTPARVRPDLNQLRPDQICVYKYGDGDSTGRSMAYIVEYKAPHKLTPPHLRLGLRPMDIYKEVVNRATQPTEEDPEALFQYHADKLVAAAVTQTFHYMIEGALDYALLTTGETIVFLRIDWTDPTVLYYHLAEPGPEVLAHPENSRYCTAVGQVLAYSLMALGSPGQRQERGQEERQTAVERLKTWTEDYETILRSIPISERKAPPSSPGYQPRTYKAVDRSPYLFRKKRNRAEPDRQNASVDGERTPEPSDDESGAQMPDTPSPDQPRKPGQDGQQSLARPPRDGGQGSSVRHREYCTQKCLLGLVRKELLDENCPNVALHRRQSGDARHPVDHPELLRLLREQLRRTLDDGVACINRGGARGVLFRVTLLEYGYTFVSKGTVEEFVEDLEHEAIVYHRLQPLQGVCVPVFLGNIDLRDISRIYYYDFRVRVVYMMFLSWAGDKLDVTTLDLERELLRSVRRLHTMGVAHTDVRKPNALWSRETRRVMMIDFERAVLMDPPRAPLTQLVPNKRARPSQGFFKADQPSSGGRRQVWNDIAAVKLIFSP